MKDPDEGLDADGHITTGAHHGRVPGAFEPLLDAVRSAIAVSIENHAAHGEDAGLYLYGSVATGQAVPGVSDVDLLTIGIPGSVASAVGLELSARYSTLCRGVEFSVAQHDDFVGEGDAAYGNRVFLHHYCLPLLGTDVDRGHQPFPGDRRAARGFNGDIGASLVRWRESAASSPDAELGRRVARKTLLAVAGLVSVHDSTWTTDRESSAVRWGHLHPNRAPDLHQLAGWADGSLTPSPPAIAGALGPDGVVAAIVEDFGSRVGLWC